jgi:polygalacturonase
MMRYLMGLVLAARLWSQQPDAHRNLRYTADAPDAVERSVGAKLDERISVKDFGAHADGVDDTSHIQDALDYLSSVDGGTLYKIGRAHV